MTVYGSKVRRTSRPFSSRRGGARRRPPGAEVPPMAGTDYVALCHPSGGRRTRWRWPSPTTPTAARCSTPSGRSARSSRRGGRCRVLGARPAMRHHDGPRRPVRGRVAARAVPRARRHVRRGGQGEGGVVRNGVAAHQLRAGRAARPPAPSWRSSAAWSAARPGAAGTPSTTARGGHDDLANAVAGALVAAAEAPRVPQIRMTAIRVPIRRAARWTEL